MCVNTSAAHVHLVNILLLSRVTSSPGERGDIEP